MNQKLPIPANALVTDLSQLALSKSSSAGFLIFIVLYVIACLG